jgi:hypothetical protein
LNTFKFHIERVFFLGSPSSLIGKPSTSSNFALVLGRKSSLEATIGHHELQTRLDRRAAHARDEAKDVVPRLVQAYSCDAEDDRMECIIDFP